jgi:hypothetical protein
MIPFGIQKQTVEQYKKQNKNCLLMLFAHIVKYIVLIVTFSWMYNFIQVNQIDATKTTSLISMLVTTIGVMSAIVITFLFGKMFSERTERITRKYKIDGLSKKLTSLRLFFYHLMSAHDFWIIENNNAKSTIDGEYSGYTWKKFDKLNTTERDQLGHNLKFPISVFGIYIAIKDLVGNKLPNKAYNESYRENYKTNELDEREKLFNHIWAYFQDPERNMPDFSSIDPVTKDQMLSCLKSAGIELRSKNDISIPTIVDILNFYPENYIKELYSLTKRNKSTLLLPFKCLILDLIILIIILIICVFFSSVKNEYLCNLNCVSIVVPIFVCSTIDILINILCSIKRELTIDDFYQ